MRLSKNWVRVNLARSAKEEAIIWKPPALSDRAAFRTQYCTVLSDDINDDFETLYGRQCCDLHPVSTEPDVELYVTVSACLEIRHWEKKDEIISKKKLPWQTWTQMQLIDPTRAGTPH